MLDDRFLGAVEVLFAPGAGRMQHPGVGLAVTPGFAAVARQPVERAALYKTTFHRRIEGGLEGQGNGPRRLHFYPRSGTGQFGRAGQQGGGLWRRCGDDDVAEGAVLLAFGIEQMPVFFTPDQVSDLAGKADRQLAQQAAGNGAHARRAHPAGLFVRGGGQLAIFIVVQMGFPLDGPAVGLPLLDFIDKTAVASGEILSPQVQYPDIAALARHASAAATAFIEQMNHMPRLVQEICCCQPGYAGTDNCDGYSH